ncbi:MAG: HD domain-containing protein [Oscillospiraceae bacterium]|nr:HD domain-containing protein [Oscillospiraceae bacterium]MDD6084633.1 HD domain-containing protein [Oscillospiraceae bacterium]MDY3256883.1 HD domain-containing protein [Ruminococcus callidus]
MSKKDEFIEIYNENIKRHGADNLLKWLEKSDFFTAPASTRYHGSFEGGLVEHSVNVYHCLKDYLSRERAKTVYNMNYSEETIAVAALLHDICKTNFYTVSTRNKKENGKWVEVPFYSIDDKMPYGHGEKSVFMIQFFMRLEMEEAFAIRFHMGFSGPEDVNLISRAFEMYPLAYALHVADCEATYFLEKSN